MNPISRMSKYKNSRRIGIGMEGGEGFAYSTRAQESLMPYMGILFAIVLFFILVIYIFAFILKRSFG